MVFILAGELQEKRSPSCLKRSSADTCPTLTGGRNSSTVLPACRGTAFPVLSQRNTSVLSTPSLKVSPGGRLTWAALRGHANAMVPAMPGLGVAKRHRIQQREEVSFSRETPSQHTGPSPGLLACCQEVNCAQALLIGYEHHMAACCSGFLQLGERERGERERGGEREGERGRAGENEGQARPGDTGSTRESTHSQQQLPDTPTLKVRQEQGGRPGPLLLRDSAVALGLPSLLQSAVLGKAWPESELRALLLHPAAAACRIQARPAALCSSLRHFSGSQRPKWVGHQVSCQVATTGSLSPSRVAEPLPRVKAPRGGTCMFLESKDRNLKI